MAYRCGVGGHRRLGVIVMAYRCGVGGHRRLGAAQLHRNCSRRHASTSWCLCTCSSPFFFYLWHFKLVFEAFKADMPAQAVAGKPVMA